ncbi:FecR family protein [Sphingomonas xinjiangensis]|uniref:Transmembrane sensor n=1 Tax=Sphingomonas xinjiangensis TaxID=643568 RepID=A0A840YSP8_9SPHN|nr:FecR domain-containing protein [Sphingomonas xinjiangensis]MBB5712721.1 transmembrane sensor [Sphingomonas xinjiangensis]
MPNRETASEIDETAVNWAARAERGLVPEERADLDRWLDGDSRHLGAFVRAQAAWIHAERAGALGRMPEPEDGQKAEIGEEALSIRQSYSRGLSRRMVLGGSAAAASLGAAYLVGFNRDTTLESGIGEIRHIKLAGGTTLTLDTDTRVDIARSSQDRALQLVRGKLFVEVANWRNRPLAVRAEGIMLEIVEGAFGVQSLSQAPLVALVTNGKLLVEQSQGIFGQPRTVTVQENQALTMFPRDQLDPRDVRSVQAVQREQLLAWRDGMLSFGGELLSDAVRSFDRYGSTRIVVADPHLARQKITGLFKANDAKGFARAVAASFGADVRDEGGIIRLVAKNIVST